MRRTEQEFKEELWKRTRAYRQKQARKRRNLLAAGMCACICCVAVTIFDPFGASSEAPAARDDAKLEYAVSMEVSDGGMVAQEAPAENAAAPMAPEPEEAKCEAPAAEAETNMSGTGEPGAASGSSRLYNVVSVEVNTAPANEEYQRFFTSKEQIVPIIVALERFYPVDDQLQEPEPTEGMAYEITVTYVNKTVHYTLFGDGLYSDTEGWIRFDATAARKLETALAQDSDIPSITVICGEEEISLDAADSAVIMEYLSSDGWNMPAANCLCDYTLEAGGETYHYHSDCGTVQNEYGESLTLSEKDKEIFNEILASCAQ